VQFLEQRFENCGAEGAFDAVIGSSVLHHLDLKKALARILSVLRPGGSMSFAEPNMLNPQIVLQKNVPWLKKRLGDSPDETAFARWPLRALLLKTGFVEVEITPFDWLHPATPVPMINTVMRLGLVLERVPFLREFAGSLHIRCRRE
jgi:SAM-dependent methyltransferase